MSSTAGVTRKVDHLFIIVLGILAFLTPFHKVATSIPMILVGLVWLSTGNWSQKWTNIKSYRTVILLSVGFFTIHAMSMIYTESTGTGIKLIRLKILLPAMLLVILSSGLKKEDVKRVLTCLIIGCIGISIMCLVNATFKTSSTGDNFFFYKRLVSVTNIHPTYLGMIVSFAIVELIGRIRDGLNSKKPIWYLVLGASYLTFFVFLISSRVSIVALIVVILFAVIFIAWEQKKLLIGAGIFALLSIGIVSVIVAHPDVNARFKRLIEPQNSIADGRVIIWPCSMELIKTKGITGVGIGDVKNHLVKCYAANNFQDGVDEKLDCHNQYLQTWAGTGIVGCFLLLLCLVMLFGVGWMAKHIRLILFVLIVSVTFSTEVILGSQTGIVPITMVAGLLILDVQQKRVSSRNSFTP